MDKIFKVIYNDSEKVVIEVLATDTLTVAMNPFVSGDYKYITITKGEDHIVSITKKDAKTFSFHFGSRGFTLISSNLELLRKKILQFLSNKNIVIE